MLAMRVAAALEQPLHHLKHHAQSRESIKALDISTKEELLNQTVKASANLPMTVIHGFTTTGIVGATC